VLQIGADPQKFSLRIDIKEFVTGQEWRGLKKLSRENGSVAVNRKPFLPGYDHS
jgi:hypothetical protein